MFFSKTYQSSLTLKGGSTAFPKPFSPQGTGDVPTALLGAQTATLYGWRTIRGLRQQQSCSFLCGDEPASTQGIAKGVLARCFFRKPTRPSFFDKAGCTRQFESELSLRSFAQPFPSGDKGCANRPFNSLYDPFGSPCRGQKRSSNRYAIRLADHQRSTPVFYAGWDRREKTC